MGVYKLSANSVKNGRTIYGSMLAGNTAFAPTSFESIATTTVGAGGASSVTFSSIPAGYTHLQLRMMHRDTGSDVNGTYVLMNFNSDTGNNYSDHMLYGDGSSVTALNYTSFPGILINRWSNAAFAANIFGVGVADILDYANTNKNKTVRTLAGWDSNGAGRIVLNSGAWLNTNAVTSITLTFSNGNSAQYSSFALYGIRSA